MREISHGPVDVGAFTIDFINGNTMEAMVNYSMALKIQEQVLGSNHLSTATTYNNVGLACFGQGKLNEALEYFFKALDIRERIIGFDYQEIASTYAGIALCYEQQKEYDKALDLFSKTLVTYDKYLGPNHNDTQVIKQCIARVEKAMRRDAKSGGKKSGFFSNLFGQKKKS